jgi:hypothetical protein
LNFDNFIFNAGTPAVTLNGGGVIIPQVLIQGGTIKARVGSAIKIPIYISPITSAQNVLSYDFVATFDTTKIKITGATIAGTLSANGNYSINTAGGKVRFAWASSTNISTAAKTTLLYLTGTAVGAGTASVNFTSVELNTGSPLAGASAATITVKNNLALAVSPVGPNYTITDGVLFTLTLNATDNTGDVLTYSVSPSTLPAGATLTGNVFTWTPTIAERSATPVALTFTVTDQDTISATQKVNITVIQDKAPTVTLSPAGPNYTVNEGTALSITINGVDNNPQDVTALTYAVTDPAVLPSGAALKANVFTWTPKYPAGRTAPYSFTFKVTDPFGASVTSTIAVTVVHVNRAPAFTVTPDYVVVPVNIPTPLVYSFQYQAVDPDGDNVSYSLIAGPVGSQIDAKTGLFSWAPTVDQAQHVYTVTVQATDGLLTVATSQFIAGSTIVDVQAVNNIPTVYSLSQNYPNPFNPTTQIQFALPKGSFVKLSVFNVIGQEIQVLVNRNMSAGNYKVNFDASKLNSGMYLYRIETADFTSVRKMLLVK